MAQLHDLFKTHALVKILDFLTLYKDFEYTRTDIANETGISRRTLYEVFPILEKYDLVMLTKQSGMIRFYKLNMENPISKQLVALADTISFFRAGKTAGIELISASNAPVESHIVQLESEPPMKVSFTKMEFEGTPTQVQNFVQEKLDWANDKATTSMRGSTNLPTFEAEKKGR
jgi:hypothetical protein